LGVRFLWVVPSLLVYLAVSCRTETIELFSESGQASTCSAIEPCPMISADQPLCRRLVIRSFCGLICIVCQMDGKLGMVDGRQVRLKCCFILQTESEWHIPRSPLHYETRRVGLSLGVGINRCKRIVSPFLPCSCPINGNEGCVQDS
jgi:hypothetical protein